MLLQKEKLGSRNYVFRYETPFEWKLNLHVILGETRNFLIDTGLGPGSLTAALDLISVESPKKDLMVINTHAHWDHIFGNWALKHCPIISHDFCREEIINRWDGMILSYQEYALGPVKMAPPHITFSDALSFPEDGVDLFYTPGHDRDCISVLDRKDGVLNAGDNIGDEPAELLPELECSLDVYKKTLNQYQAQDFDYLVSGHNEILGKETISKILTQLA